MDVEEKLRQARTQFLTHQVDKEAFADTFRTRVQQRTPLQTRSVLRRRILASGAAVVLVGGILFSPGVADAIQRVPLVNVVLNWVRGTDAAPYVRSVQKSVTDNGITMTITDVLYGPSELSFGYIVTPSQPGFPHGGAVGLGGSGMQFFVNGKKVQLEAAGDDAATSYGFKGMVRLDDAGTGKLPASFDLQIVIHKIGHRWGTWQFNVPVSAKNMKPVQTFSPKITKRVGPDVLTIQQVQIYPTGGKLDFQVTEPTGQHTPVNLVLFDQNKQLIDSLSGDTLRAVSHTVSGDRTTWSFSQNFRIPPQKLTALFIRPSVQTNKHRTLPLSGPFPVTIDNGLLGTMTITSTRITGNTVTVRYTMTHGNGVEASLHFSVTDVSNPNARMEGDLGEPVSQSPSGDQYIDVYTFDRDISTDRLVLDLPDSNRNVFEVPLGSKPYTSSRSTINSSS